MSEKELNSFRTLVHESLINDYNVTEIEALELISDSTFNDLLEIDPIFVAHYEPEYWAKEVFEEHHVMQT